MHRALTSLYGVVVPPGKYNPRRGVIAAPESSPAGNLVLRVGREHIGGEGWHQTEHVVLEPAEAERLALDILHKLGAPES